MDFEMERALFLWLARGTAPDDIYTGPAVSGCVTSVNSQGDLAHSHHMCRILVPYTQ
jgi:hypothetical protein